jgi:hypothetical protein
MRIAAIPPLQEELVALAAKATGEPLELPAFGVTTLMVGLA